MLYALLGALLAHLPLFLVYLIGLILALTKRRFYPRASNFLLLSVLLSLVTLLFGTAFNILAPVYLMNGRNISVTTYGYYAYAIGIISNLGHAAAFGLLLAAVFSERAPSPVNRAG